MRFSSVAARAAAAALALSLTAAAVAPAPAAAAAPVDVKVMVFTLFPPELGPWVKNEPLTQTYTVKGIDTPVRCTADGLCVTMTAMGKVNAALSASAVVADPQFDFSRTVFLSSGIAGTPPEVGTLGDAAWSNWIVDWDLGHHVLPTTAPTPDQLYIARDVVGTDAYKLNPNLVSLAYSLTKDTALIDSDDAKAYRALYPGQEGRTPAVLQCDNVTGDDYWHGRELSQLASSIVKLRSAGTGTYCSTAMEDTGIASALSRAGLLDRYVALRTMSNFDQPHPGQTVTESLNGHSGGFPLSIENQYRVGSAFAHYVVAHRDEVVASTNLDLTGNGHLQVGDALLGTPVVTENNRTLVPVRDLALAMGAKVEWLDASATVRLEKDGQVILLPVGTNSATVGGDTVTLEVGARIHGGHALVPVRFVAEALGAKVTWDPATGTVKVALQ